MGQKAPTTKALRYYFLSKRPASPQGIQDPCTYNISRRGKPHQSSKNCETI